MSDRPAYSGDCSEPIYSGRCPECNQWMFRFEAYVDGFAGQLECPTDGCEGVVDMDILSLSETAVSEAILHRAQKEKQALHDAQPAVALPPDGTRCTGVTSRPYTPAVCTEVRTMSAEEMEEVRPGYAAASSACNSKAVDPLADLRAVLDKYPLGFILSTYNMSMRPSRDNEYFRLEINVNPATTQPRGPVRCEFKPKGTP